MPLFVTFAFFNQKHLNFLFKNLVTIIKWFYLCNGFRNEVQNNKTDKDY